MGKSIFYESRQYRGGHAYTISGELVHWNLSNNGPEAPEQESFEIVNIFPIQMH